MGLALPVLTRATPITGAQVPAPSQPAPPAPPQAAPPPNTQTPPPASATPPAPTPPAPLYEKAWTAEIDAAQSPRLAIAPPVVVLGGAGTPLDARALDDGHAAWTAAVPNAPPYALAPGLVLTIGDGRLRAIDSATGRVRWDVAAEGDTPGPAVFGDVVLFPTGPIVRAHRVADGSPIWQVDLAAMSLTPMAASPTLALAALSDNTIAALDLQSGALRWRTPVDVAPSWIAGGAHREYFATKTGWLCGLTPGSGKIDWPFNFRIAPAGPPVVGGDLVFIALLDNTVRALDSASGQLKRRDDLPSRPAGAPTLVGTTEMIVPLITGGFAVLNRTTGKIAGVVTPEAGQTVVESAAVADDGSALAVLTIAPGARRTLTVYRRTPPPAAPVR